VKTLLENWRRYGKSLLAEQSRAAQALVKYHDVGLEKFVAVLKQIASDPEFRKLALAGQNDPGGPPDEAITVSKGQPVAAKNLTPTQKDIDLEKSLGDQMTNKWKPPATETALFRGAIEMPSPGGAQPVLTYGNKYILDGHHRWSQVMMTNPDGMMAVNNLSGPALPNEEVALKATQLAIAALAGQVVTKDTKINLLAVDEEYIKNYVRKRIQPAVLELLVKYNKISKPDPDLAAEYYAGNLAAIKEKPPGKFARAKGMPQADDSGVPQVQVNTALAKGNINFDDPSLRDLKGARPKRR
jgi:hypothetical protein